MHPDTLVTIATFTHPQEAAVIRARLEWEGIPCHLKDEHTVQVHPFYSNAIGGVKLQVRAGEADRARALLMEADLVADGDGEAMHTDEDPEMPRMPQLGPAAMRRLALVIVVLLLLLVVLLM
jgi:hypothetical protein